MILQSERKERVDYTNRNYKVLKHRLMFQYCSYEHTKDVSMNMESPRDTGSGLAQKTGSVTLTSYCLRICVIYT